MAKFEEEALRRFDTVIAVSERDANWFRERYGVQHAFDIPTGTDLDYFQYREPGRSASIVFIGSMDWMPNVDGVRFLLDEVWPRVRKSRDDIDVLIVGRNPPRSLLRDVAAKEPRWRVTGAVPDIRPFVHDAGACVIPLHVGGGTRIKAFEAMALGCPVVSTALGVEGLGLNEDRHFLQADTADDFAAAILRLLGDRKLQLAVSRAARDHVVAHGSSALVAKRFEHLCLETIASRVTR
jgi:glycosyltransferase involved in cell wall biosynthesis